MKKKIKLIVSTILACLMGLYLVFVFYLSEPKYVNNSYKPLEKYDYVSIPKYQSDMGYPYNEVMNGIVLQVDSTKALVKIKRYSYSEYYQLDLNRPMFRIIGRGTIYHKINDYVGFNIMLFSQIFIGIFMIIIIVWISTTLADYLK